MEKFSIALKVKAKHGKLQKFIDDMGWTQSDFAKHIGIDASRVADWFNLKNFPRDPEHIIKICELLGDTPENIFPEFIKDKSFLKRKKTAILYREIDTLYFTNKELNALPADTRYNEADDVRLNDALDILTPREKMILTHRFGLNGEDEKTLDEVGELQGASRERIRQIESKALRKLRRSGIAKKYLGVEYDNSKTRS